jgi:tryptophan synthase alpha chain
MKAHERIGAALTAANNAGRPALVPFITAGYPEPTDFISTLKAIAEVGDVVELGIPFSDPMADGMTIQRSSFEALQKGVSLRWIFDQLDSAAAEINAPLVMMSYLMHWPNAHLLRASAVSSCRTCRWKNRRTSGRLSKPKAWG